MRLRACPNAFNQSFERHGIVLDVVRCRPCRTAATCFTTVTGAPKMPPGIQVLQRAAS